MSKFTVTTLYENSMVGNGYSPWWDSDALRAWGDKEGIPSPFFDGPIDPELVRSRLFGWEPLVIHPRVPIGANGEWIEDENSVALIHPETRGVIAYHGAGYTPLSYGDCLVDLAGQLAGAGIGISSAGVLGENGERAYVQFGSPGAKIESPMGAVHPYLLAVSAHDGTCAFRVGGTHTVVVCDNTCTAALLGMSRKDMFLGEEGIAIRHTASAADKAITAKTLVRDLKQSSAALAERMDKLSSVSVTDEAWEAFVTAYGGDPDTIEPGAGKTRCLNRREALYELWESDSRVTPFGHTLLTALHCADLYSRYLGVARGDRATALVSRLVKGEQTKRDAFAWDSACRAGLVPDTLLVA